MTAHHRGQLRAGAVRRVDQPGEHRMLVRQRGREIAVEAQHLPGALERVRHEAAGDRGADRIEPVLERGCHAEIAAAAADGPEQVRMLLSAGLRLLGRQRLPARPIEDCRGPSRTCSSTSQGRHRV